MQGGGKRELGNVIFSLLLFLSICNDIWIKLSENVSAFLSLSLDINLSSQASFPCSTVSYARRRVPLTKPTARKTITNLRNQFSCAITEKNFGKKNKECSLQCNLRQAISGKNFYQSELNNVFTWKPQIKLFYSKIFAENAKICEI